ncbi:MAG TPA: hypothetical protein VJV78_33575 [Polyangiales bacterium]|nr:hypothetical protein [Polyangiales bacterium]
MILDRIGSQSDFVTMVGLAKLQPGYYGDVLEYPFHNPARGGMRWMLGSSCGSRAGWFVVDHVTYGNDLVRELDLRFESGCIGQSPPLHGQVHYVAP